MFPTDFDESNIVIDKPPGMSRDDCDAINAYVQGVPGWDCLIVTCWKPTKEELEEINRTGRVWVFHYGAPLQPHAVSGENPFAKREEET